MIATLTLNPCIDLNLEIEAFDFAHPARALRERRRPGGKGVNVATVLHLLGDEPTAVVLLGGHTGQEFLDLSRERVEFPLRVVAQAGNTRTNIVLTATSDGRHLKVNERGSEVRPEEIQQVQETLDYLLKAGDFLVLAGSLPPGAPPDTYAALIRRFREKGCFVALDSDLAALREGMPAHPHLIKPNREELKRLVETPLDTEEDLLHAARRLVEEQCDLCLITDGPRPAYLVTRDQILRGIPPEAPAGGSPVGAGDACLAGMLKALHNTMRVESGGAGFSHHHLREAFHLALACGSASASTPDTEYFTADILSRCLDAVRVEIL